MCEVDPKLLAALDDTPERQNLQQMLQEERESRNVLSLFDFDYVSLCAENGLFSDINYYITRIDGGVADMIVEEGDADDVPLNESVFRQQVELAHSYFSLVFVIYSI